MRKITLGACIIICTLVCLACAAGGENPGDEELGDPLSGKAISTVAELKLFIEKGTTETAILAASIDLGNEMLRIPAERGSLTIEGNGFALVGRGDSVIRLDDGVTITINDLTVKGSACGIGMMGDNQLSGRDLRIEGGMHAVSGLGSVQIGSESKLSIEGGSGFGLSVRELTVSEGAVISASGGSGAIHISGSAVVQERAEIDAVSGAYNAFKCGKVLSMLDGSRLSVANTGDYHGAEITELSIEGTVSIYAHGGTKGVGLFLMELYDELTVIGECDPPARSESGRGKIKFVKNAPESTPASQGSGEE